MSVIKVKAAKKKVSLQEEIPNLFERSKTWLEVHPYPILGAMVALLVAAILYWGINSYKSSREITAGADYAQVMKSWPEQDASDPKGMEKVVSELEKYIADHQGTKLVVNAKLDLARAYFQMRRYDDALKLSKAVLDDLSSDSVLRPLARYQIALTSQALGKVDEALDNWKALKTGGLPGLDREIDWSMAKLYAGKGDFPKSIEQYELAMKDSGAYPPIPQLQDELSAIKLKTASSSQAPKSDATKDEPKG